MVIKLNTAIIIVNWNGQRLLGDCLMSLQEQSYQNFEIILVDNGSTDGSVDYVRENFSKVKIIELIKNTGFAKGNNIGISVALQGEKVENIILLNNDTKVKKDFVEQLVKYQEQQQQRGKISMLQIGALVPKMLLWDASRPSLEVDSVIDAVGAKIGLDGRGYSIGHGEKDNGQYDKSQEVFGFCGGAVLLRKEALEDVTESQKSKVKSRNLPASEAGYKVESGKYKVETCLPARQGRNKKQTVRQGRTVGKADLTVKYQEYFDDNFFAYYEDSDLSYRLQSRGWRIVTVPEAVVYHLHSATTDSIKSKTFKAYYLNRNRFFMMLKNYPLRKLWKGMLLVPRSYFRGGSNKSAGNEKNKTKEKNLFLKKIVMIGVMGRVAGSLVRNFPRIIRQRRAMQKHRNEKNS